MNALYSTPGCYIQHVHRANLTWGGKREDFHPYAIEPGQYWTGYFTSRSGQKLLIKRAGATLQVTDQLTSHRRFYVHLYDFGRETGCLQRMVVLLVLALFVISTMKVIPKTWAT